MSGPDGAVRRVIVGVSGGIAAYKACSVIRHFTEQGDEVRVVPTASALEFVGSATFEALSGRPVHAGVFTDVEQVPHVRLGQEADLVVIAPATADLLARAALGRADDLLTATLLTARCPVVFAPAMHTEMWQHPATEANVHALRERGATVVEPASGRLTGVDSGAGRLPDPAEICVLADLLLERADAIPRDLVGTRMVVTAGATNEPLDPVRFLGNRSSGKQGYALARLAAQRGAEVTLISGATVALPDPPAVDVRRIGTALELEGAVAECAAESDVVVMAAAVADFRPARRADAKIKKDSASEPHSVPLERNPDILTGLVERRDAGSATRPRVIVGFAAETGDGEGDALHHGRAKFARKGCELLVVNTVGEGRTFGTDSNDGWLLAADGAQTPVGHGSKSLMASRILDSVAALLGDGHCRT